MKRFYTDVAVGPDRGILLDGRPVRTPARALLILPTAALAEGVAEEWRAQGEQIDPRAMPFTGLANAAIDRVAPDPHAFAKPLAAYAETDLLCYRAEDPPELIAAEAAAWDPLLAWARGRYDVRFEVANGIVHRPQPAATIARLSEALAARDAFALAAFNPMITISGSLVVALAVAERMIPAEGAFALTHLDELWQADHWGEDWMAADMRAAHKCSFVSAAEFLMLLEN